MGTPDDERVFAKMKDWNPIFPRCRPQDMGALHGTRLSKDGVDLLEGLLKLDAKQRTPTDDLAQYAYLNDEYSTGDGEAT